MRLRVLPWLPVAVLVAGCAETIFHPPPGTRFIAVTAGGAHSCALDQDGYAWCWGSNRHGQLGIVRRNERVLTPVAVNGSFQFRSISAGDRHTCGVDVQGRGLCWGANDSGQLGDGTRSERDAPRFVIDAPAFAEISAGARHSCAVDASARVHCWGANESLQLGSEGGAALLPRLVPAVSGARTVSVGARHSCATDALGAVCWGANERLQVGAVPPAARAAPTRPAVPNLVLVSAGDEHGCALALATGVVCWGANEDGRAVPSSSTDPTPPALVELPVSAPVVVSAGARESCVLAGDAVWCWGGEAGERAPRAVAGLDGVVSALDVGGGHACVLVTGALACWGEGSEGQLGHGSRGDSEIAVP